MEDCPIERELKLEAGVEFSLPDLTGVVPGVRVDDQGERDLEAIYYDTADHRLMRRGVTLRHRHGEASGPAWTLKVPVTSSGKALERRELEWAAPADQRPGAVDQLTIGVRAGRPLVAVATLRTRRRLLVLRDADGKSLAEVTDDRVTAAAPGGPVSFRELEVELTGGEPALLDAVGARLEAEGAKAGAPQLKLQRVLGVEGAGGPALDSTSTLGEVAVAALSAGVERLLVHDPAVRLGEDVEAVHQARVATRRLRADLRLLRDLFDEDWLDEVMPTLRDVTRALGGARDLDVQLQRIQAAEVTGEVEREGVRNLAGRLGAERAAAGVELLTLMDSVAYTRLVERLLEAAAAPPWRHDPPAAKRAKGGRGGKRRRVRPDIRARKVLPDLLRRRWRKVRKTVRAMSEPPTPGELHTVRKRSKELRYNAELAAPVLGPGAARLAERAEALQETLGEHHDAVVAAEWLYEAAADASRPEAFAAGDLVHAARRRRAEAEEAWPEVWGQLADKGVRKAVW